jgi:N-acyl-D-aspartate/D-glutamate deacylase
MTAQVAPRGVGVLLGLRGSRNIFTECPSYQAIDHLPLPERVAAMATPEMRKRLLDEQQAFNHTRLGQRLVEFTNQFVFDGPPNYQPGPQDSVAAIAARQGRPAAEVAYDIMLSDEGKGILYSPFANYAEGNLDVCGEMLADPNTVLGLGDGGAHVALICDASFTTFLLSYWGKQRGAFDVGWLVKRQTADTARVVGLTDRGLLAPGMKADINLIDLDRLDIDAPHMVFDLPAGGRRLLQKADGYVATIVSGEVVYREGEATAALPGRLVRSTS